MTDEQLRENHEFQKEITRDFEEALGPHPRYVNGCWIERIKDLKKERDELAEWKRQALSVYPPMQEIGKELGLTLGDTIHDKILPGIITLKKLAGLL